MASFVLVDSACFGGWAWKRVVPLLRSRGHEVHTAFKTKRKSEGGIHKITELLGFQR
jgi:hypothetical protein